MKNVAIRNSLILLAFTTFFNPAFAQSTASASQDGETGIAMYYADYLHGQSTALGEIYNKYELTCSHMYHPKGTLLKVTRLDNNKTVTVRVNDRGTFQNSVIIDLSWAAAMELDLIKLGKAWVKVENAGYSNLNPVNPNREKVLSDRGVSSYDNTSPNNSQLTTKSGYINDYYRSNTTTTSDPNKPTWDNLTIKSPNATSTNPMSFETTPRSAAMSNTALNSGYGIQVGSYTVYDNAERMVENLRNTGVSNTYIKESYSSSGAMLYRVVIGSFTSRADATSFLQRLRTSYIADGIVMSLSK